jgi:hypothetical protein
VGDVGNLAGVRSGDEMCHLWLQVLPVITTRRGGDPGMVLQEALARHNVEKNPADFDVHYNLAAMLEARNRLEAAIREYHLAVKLRPDDAAGNNGLGAALVAAGHPEQGVPYLQSALDTSRLFRSALQPGIRPGGAGRF